VFGSFAALVRFARGGLADPRRAWLMFRSGSPARAALVLAIPASVLRPVVVVLLTFAAAFVGLRRGPPAREEDAPPRRGALPIAGAIALAIGAYDGFFGPGTGTFLILGFVALGTGSPAPPRRRRS
jgi:uncharacterized membrane protein YfcA